MEQIEQIDWLEYDKKEHVMSWVILECMSKLGIENFEGFDASKITLDFKINGIRVPFIPIMDFLNSQLDEIKESGVKMGKEEMRYELSNLIEQYEPV